MLSIIKRAMIAAAVLAAALGFNAFGQTSFNLERKHGQYYFRATVNGKPDTEVLVTTGYPAIFLNQEAFDKILADAPLREVASDAAVIQYYQGDFTVRKTFEGDVSIGGLTFSGKILVTTGNRGISVPLHMLKNEADPAARMARFDIRERRLDFVSPAETDTAGMGRYAITAYNPLPVVETTLELSDTYGHNATIAGPFVFDLANGSPLFLFSRDPSTSRFLKSNKFKRLTAKTRKGKKVGKGIFSGYCKVGDRTARGISIGISDKTAIPALGCVGPAMFHRSLIIIDPADNVILYEKSAY